jgi:thioredoxin 1
MSTMSRTTASGWVVCLCAEWCGTCRDYRPALARLAQAHPHWCFAWVDIEEHADLLDEIEVETFPTVLVADEAGQRFFGPLLPHIETLARLLGALPAARPLPPPLHALLAGIARTPAAFAPAAA